MLLARQTVLCHTSFKAALVCQKNTRQTLVNVGARTRRRHWPTVVDSMHESCPDVADLFATYILKVVESCMECLGTFPCEWAISRVFREDTSQLVKYNWVRSPPV